MVSGCAEYSVCRSMTPRDISAVTLRGEVVNNEQHILCMKSQNLERIPSGRPRAWQVQPIHCGAEVLLM
jgi:hypothetical protein